jgi:hypothetical protein
MHQSSKLEATIRHEGFEEINRITLDSESSAKGPGPDF